MIIKTSPDEIENYLTDASNFKGYCSEVYLPENTGEISGVLHDANHNKTPVTIAGNGTGLAGARVPEGGIVISTERLNKIIEINEQEMYAVVEPGVVLDDFQNILKEKKLMYPPDPTEKNCFIGGTVATNASGEKTFKYGPTRNYVLAIEVVLANGDLLKLTRGKEKALSYKLELNTEWGVKYNLEIPDFKMPETKNASGYFCKSDMDAIDLFIGSEGTLGLITKIKLRIVPLPKKIISCVVFFNSEREGLSFINKAREISYDNRKLPDNNLPDALALEFFDEKSLNFLMKDYANIPYNAKAGVWFEQEALDSNEDILFEKWMELIKEFNGDEDSAWFALNDAEIKKIQLFRHSISAKVNEYISRHHFRKLGTDVAVPDNEFEKFYFSSKEIVEKNSLNYVAYGHFGNSHVHLNILPKTPEEFETGKKVYDEICKKAVEYGGTVSAEHGIGKLKVNYFLEMCGADNVKKMAALKKSLDPNFILGEGNIFKKNILDKT
jgi:D-lactate dehydrogenase (cytochrome)